MMLRRDKIGEKKRESRTPGYIPQEKKRKIYLAAAIICIVLFCIYIALYYLVFSSLPEKSGDTDEEALTVSFLDVGQGDCVLLLFPDGETALIDSGPAENAENTVTAIKNAGVTRIDTVFLTHPHADHIGGISACFEAFKIGEVVLSDISATVFSASYSDVTELIGLEDGCMLKTVSSGQTFSLGKVFFSVLGPNSTVYEDENDLSLVLRAVYGDTSFLFTGDAGYDSESDILDLYREDALKSDVLKIGHHGSKTASSLPFLQTVSPSCAVIQCSLVNEYGHPHAVILSLLSQLGITVYRNDLQGTVTFRSNGKEISVITGKP